MDHCWPVAHSTIAALALEQEVDLGHQNNSSILGVGLNVNPGMVPGAVCALGEALGAVQAALAASARLSVRMLALA